MKNNKGLGRFETIVITLVLLVIFAFLFKVLLDSVSGKDFSAMRSNAASFGKAVNTNADFFHNSGKVSLGEAIGEKTINKIKNPVGKGYCDESESKVVLNEDGKYLVTLRCGEYLIDSEPLTTIESAKIYEIGECQDKEFEGADKITLYNCDNSGSNLYPDYYDELYFIYKINQDNGTNYFNADSVEATCKVLKKDCYRTKKVMEE